MFGSDLEHRVWSRFWNWNLANILRLVLTWDLTIFGNTIGNKNRGEVIARTWFHSFFSRKKSEIWIAFTFFEKWKVKNKILSLFFEKWKWNWNGSRSRTRSENEKKFSRILEKRESRWSLQRSRGLNLNIRPLVKVSLRGVWNPTPNSLFGWRNKLDVEKWQEATWSQTERTLIDDIFFEK